MNKMSNKFLVCFTTFTVIIGMTISTNAYDQKNSVQNANKNKIEFTGSLDLFLIAQTNSPVIGQYKWFNGDIITVNGNGTLKSARGDQGRWERGANNSYTFHWNSGWIDRLVLSPNGSRLDGNTLEPGSNNTYKVFGTKISIAGIYDWFNGDIMTVNGNGTLKSARGDQGRWERGANNSYTFRWNSGWIDRLILSPDGSRLDGNTLEPGSSKTYKVWGIRRS
jgi:hypothetical protein